MDIKEATHISRAWAAAFGAWEGVFWSHVGVFWGLGVPKGVPRLQILLPRPRGMGRSLFDIYEGVWIGLGKGSGRSWVGPGVAWDPEMGPTLARLDASWS